MESTENKQPTYTFVELLPVLTTFCQTIHLCDRALADNRLLDIDENIASAISTIRNNVTELIDLISCAAH